MPNRLIRESSPYLRQHAHNPVDWHPWNEDSLQKARETGRMLLISIGYSACHWCHVMERESFMDAEVAGLMNRHFICIKVDREERPDVDMVYMNAVQLVTGSGGWPLNCFAMPDGRPFFGGTYFRRSQWIQLLENIALLYETRRDDLESQAAALTQGIRSENLIHAYDTGPLRSAEAIPEIVKKLNKQLDRVDGGLAGAPKFPMPVLLGMLLDYLAEYQDDEMLSFLKLTLAKMAFGGIYDQVGGGFSRYSTDTQWKVPHFEKMLYDNAQLVSIYARAFHVFEEPLYREVAEETLEFVRREMTGPEGAFFSALDADSEGEEGKYYLWRMQEFREALGKHADLVGRFYQVGSKGLWEQGRNILLRTMTAADFAKSQGLQPSAFKAILKPAKQKLLRYRANRQRPGLDDKILVSWNALMAKAYTDAFLALGKPGYLQAAIRNTEFILASASREDGGLNHTVSSGPSPINGFLEDYALMADHLLQLYQATFEEKWLRKALELAEYAIRHFHDADSGLLCFSSALDAALVARKTEIHDNVVPSSNSVMARVLNHLGVAFDREDLVGLSRKMLEKMKPVIHRHPASFANWASLWMEQENPERVIAVCGPGFREKIETIRQFRFPGITYFGSDKASDLPYLHNRFVSGMTLIYYCTGKECKLPTEETEVVKNLLSRQRNQD